MKMLNIVLFGPPGAGKGTQSERMMEKYNLTHISTGDLFRKHITEGTELGKLAHVFIDNGNLVPDEIVIRMVEMKINSNTNSRGFIFDGFPRTVAQAKALDEMLENNQTPISVMIALEVDDEELKDRIRLRGKTSGRTDDQDEEKINNRIKVYKEETLPVAHYYDQFNKLHLVNGVGSVDEIFHQICEVVDSLILKTS